MKRRIKDYAFLLSLAGVIIALDQWTKTLVRRQIPFGNSWSPWDWLTPYARIVHWNNTGAAFGIFQGYNIVFTLLAIVVSIAILYYFPRISPQDRVIRLALAMQLGGAVGNLIDRVTVGQVTDFISLGNFAVFNVADSSISVGVAILLLAVLYKDWKEKNKVRLKPDMVQATLDINQPSTNEDGQKPPQ